jgi:hypothetical protein
MMASSKLLTKIPSRVFQPKVLFIYVHRINVSDKCRDSYKIVPINLIKGYRCSWGIDMQQQITFYRELTRTRVIWLPRWQTLVLFIIATQKDRSDSGPVWFSATVCQTKLWQPQVI